MLYLNSEVCKNALPPRRTMLSPKKQREGQKKRVERRKERGGRWLCVQAAFIGPAKGQD